jgi:CPA1 family monovalent cation:H+ antiporter
MLIVEITLGLVAVCIGFALVARRLDIPYAVALVLGGMALAFIPGLPEVRLDPSLALAFFLPPLLQASAWRTDWRDFRANLRPIVLLAVGCVAFTAACVGIVAKLLVPEMPWAAAIALGAIVSPPDAVAAEAVLDRLRMPARIVTVLEGESLINDAAALVLYRFAVLAATATIAPSEAFLTFLLVGTCGVAVGWAVGRIEIRLIPRLGDPMLETAATFLGCYASYLAAEALHVSGVIAVVTTGLVLGRAQHLVLDARTRVASQTIWTFVEFLFNSLVFVIIGLQLRHVVGRLDIGFGPLAAVTGAVAATVILSRFVWVFPASWIPRLIPAVRRIDPSPGWRALTVVSWAGMRGVVSLAAALALPAAFPFRDLIVFLAFAVILVTLVLQGTTLATIIRRLGIEEQPFDGGIDPDEAQGRYVAFAAALASIEAALTDPLYGGIAADIVGDFRERAGYLGRSAANAALADIERTARRHLRLDALAAARKALIAHHHAGRLRQDQLAKLERELDLETIRVRQVLGE